MSNHKRLGSNQKRILSWLLKKTEAILAGDDERARAEFKRLGVPWRVSALYSDDPANIPKDAKVKLSSSLKSLLEQHLVAVYPQTSSEKQRRTSHVKLTDQGYRYILRQAIDEGTSPPKRVLKDTIQRLTNESEAISSLHRLLTTEVSASLENGGVLSLIHKDRTTPLTAEQSRLLLESAKSGLDERLHNVNKDVTTFKRALEQLEPTPTDIDQSLS